MKGEYNMIPTKMEVTNFKGLRGKRSIEFGPLMTFCLPNAAGKTSLFDAFRWGLSGLEPEGEIVTRGEPGCRVDLTWEDGSVTSRRKSMRTGGTNCYINSSKSSMKDMNAFIAGLAGVDPAALRLCTSQDVIAGLSPDKFSEFSLSRIRLTMTAEQVASDAGAEGRMKEIVTAYFGTDPFGQTELDSFVGHCTSKRSEWRKKAQESNAAVTILKKLHEPVRGLDAVLEEKKTLDERLAAFHKWNADLRAFNQAQAEARKCADMIRVYQSKVDEIKAVEPVAGKQEALLAAKKAKEKEIRSEIGRIAESDAEIVARNKELKRLESEHCVASSRILCTTDRSCAKKDIEEEIKKLEDAKIKAASRKSALEEELVKIDAEMTAVVDNEKLWTRRKDLEEQLALLAKVKVTVPKEPVEVSDPRDEIRRCENEILACREWLRAAESAKGAKEAEAEFTAYDCLVKACGPKGPVREALLMRFLAALTEAASQKADLLHPGMRIAFITDKGIVPVLDPDGSGHYLRYEELSGGQRVTLVYLIMDLIKQLTGVRMLLLDEAGVLDDEALGTLLLLIAGSTDYDLIMLASAYHRSTFEIFESYGIVPLPIPDAERKEET